MDVTQTFGVLPFEMCWKLNASWLELKGKLMGGPVTVSLFISGDAW